MQKLAAILEKAVTKHTLSESEIIFLLKLPKEVAFPKKGQALKGDISRYGVQSLLTAADITREKYIGGGVELRALIEISNICDKNCLYCGLRRGNKSLPRYFMPKEEIVKTARAAVRQGFKTVVLQSGEGYNNLFSNKDWEYIIKNIKKLGIAVTLSLGSLTFEQYKTLKKLGADRYLLRIETTDKCLFKKMHPDDNFNERLNCINIIKKLNFETGTGTLVGLPKQTIKSIARDILFFKKVKADMIGIGPFIPNPDTPLRGTTPLNRATWQKNFNLALKVVAITRLIMPLANIPATTAMETLKKNGRALALRCGANVIMPNVTPQKYKNLYALYPGKASLGITAQKAYKTAVQELKTIGRTPSKTLGKSKYFAAKDTIR
ncbi:MAG: [FeFe] hydrogenase H-cluster radical SAM maturase HydE [Elusimicrobia bacterium]|nr:[FeFe] hydrogenase H-cluster radical SAM maturase HydE [Elusimicrobiota bacterium]